MVLLIQCIDQQGLVASIANILSRYTLNIITLREFVDKANNRFFARFVCEGEADFLSIKAALQAALPANAVVRINPSPIKKIGVLVTKEYHCLSDILIRNHYETLGAHVIFVIGNHPDLKELCDRFSIPFYLVSHEGKTKQQFEQELQQQIEQHDVDYLVLAKFMRILSPDFVKKYPYRILNIHHSFLPAFIGANPYKKAFERGVKLIGATAHFVTNDLDEGPIIAQQTLPVNHTFSAVDMVKAGKEIETAVLAKALRLVLQDSVFIYENKTVVFDV